MAEHAIPLVLKGGFGRDVPEPEPRPAPEEGPSFLLVQVCDARVLFARDSI